MFFENISQLTFTGAAGNFDPMKSKNYLLFVHGNPVVRTLLPMLLVLLGAGGALTVSSYLSAGQLERSQEHVASLKALIAARPAPQPAQAQAQAAINTGDGGSQQVTKEEQGTPAARPAPQQATARVTARPAPSAPQGATAAAKRPEPTSTAKPHAPSPVQAPPSKPLQEPARIAIPSTVNTTFEQAGIAGMDTAGVEFRSGRRIAVGGDFPSGERLISVDPGTGRIVTDKRVIVLKPTEASHSQ